MGRAVDAPARWNSRSHSFECDCGRTLRRSPARGCDNPKAIQPIIGRECGGCNGSVVSLEDFDPFA